MELLLRLIILGLWAGSIYSLVAIGLVLTRQTSGFVNFSHGATVLVSAYSAYASVEWLGFALFISGLVGSLSGCFLSISSELLIFRPMRNHDSSPLALMIASLGLLIAVQNLMAMLFGSQTLTLPTPDRTIALASSVSLSTTQVVSILGTALITGVLVALLHTNLGTKIRAVADDADLAEIFGVNPDRIIIWVSIIAGVTASVAGVLWASDNDLSSAIGFQLLLYGLVAATIGGFRGVQSAILGGLFVGIVQYVSVWKIPTQWQDSIVFAVFMAFLIFKPSGFVGVQQDRSTI